MRYLKKETITLNNKELNKFLGTNYRLNFGDLVDDSDSQILTIHKKDLNRLFKHLDIEGTSPKIFITPQGNSYLFKSNYPFLIKIEYNSVEKELII